MRTRRKSQSIRRSFMKIVRAMPGQPICGRPMAVAPTLFVIHRFQKRTVPCSTPNCELCDDLVVTEERVFLPLVPDDQACAVIVDLPGSHYETLCGAAEQYGTLSACKVLIQRTRNAANAPLSLRHRPLKPTEAPAELLPGLSEMLDGIMQSNLDFALEIVRSAKKASGGLRQVADLEPTRPVTPGNSSPLRS